MTPNSPVRQGEEWEGTALDTVALDTQMLVAEGNGLRYAIDAASFRSMPVLRVIFELEAIDRVALPDFAGSSFRGLLGHVLKNVACARAAGGGGCDTCCEPTRCAYAYLFETSAPKDNGVDRGSEEVPRPFVLVPPLEARILQPAQRFHVSLALFGRAIDYIAHFLFSLDQMGRQGIGQVPARFRVVTAFVNDSRGQRNIFFQGDSGRGRLLHEPPPTDLTILSTCGEVAPGPVELEFFTPTRLIHRGDLALTPDFHVVVRSLLRRLDLLMRVHGDGPLDLDYRAVIAQATEVTTLTSQMSIIDWERMSNRQQRRVKMCGTVGRMTYDARAAAFLPLLKAGAVTHAGKATTFGMGAYRVRLRRPGGSA